MSNIIRLILSVMKLNLAKTQILFLFLIFIYSNSTGTSRYFVSNAAELTSKLSFVQPGDTIIMKSGEWKNQLLVFNARGTKEKPIYLMAEKGGEVILNGTSTLRIAGEYLIVDGLKFLNGYSSSGAVIEFRNGSQLSSNCRLTNTAIIDYNPSDKTKDYKWISLYGNNNRIDHCYLKGKSHSGTTLVVWLPDTNSYKQNYNPNRHLIDSNYFAYRPELGVNGGETIRVGDSNTSMEDSYTVVEYNYFEECDGETEIISNKSCENIYRYNTFYNCDGMLTLRHGNRCTVNGNFFVGLAKSGSGGVRIIGEDHKVYNNYFQDLKGTGIRSALCMMNGIKNSPLNGYWQVKNALVAFNTFVNTKQTFNIGYGNSSTQPLEPINSTIANNLVYTTSSPIITYTDIPQNMFYEGNIFYGASLGINNPGGINIISPQLLKESDGIYRITSASPAFGGAVGNYAFVKIDLDGQNRNGTKDVGADQISSDPITVSKMNKDNTGPDWMRTITQLKEEPEKITTDFILYQNYPNPFNASTIIRFSLKYESDVEIKFYDLSGREIFKSISSKYAAGEHQLIVDFKDLSSGIYMYSLKTKNSLLTKKMMMIK